MGVHLHRVGSAQPFRVGFAHRRDRTNWERLFLYRERGDSPTVAHIFSRALECLGFAVCSAARFCQVRVMKHRLFVLPTGCSFHLAFS